MAPLFSKVDLNKLWHDVQNEETLIYAKFGKDLFNISNAIGRKKVAQFFLTHSVYNNEQLYSMCAVLELSHRVTVTILSITCVHFEASPLLYCVSQKNPPRLYDIFHFFTNS